MILQNFVVGPSGHINISSGLWMQSHIFALIHGNVVVFEPSGSKRVTIIQEILLTVFMLPSLT